jgi:excinuclease ABC subunit C
VGVSETAESLPTQPGVYLFKGENDRVLYVGKAQNLRMRVRTYLSGGDGRYQIPQLVERIRDIDVVVTPSVKDALLLENELIKRHKPPFNVRLRDDKQYLALRVDPSERWPRVTQVRRFRHDGAQYFGPFTSSLAVKSAVSTLRRIFPLRSCRDAVFRDYARRGRPCIEFEMKRCVGPCCDLVSEADYAELLRGTTLFLRGRSDELVTHLGERMQKAGEQERFEEAARLRDQIASVKSSFERQSVVSDQLVDRDVFGLVRDGGEVEVQVLHVREGRVIGTQGYGFSNVRVDDGEVMSSFLGQYYGAGRERQIPAEVLAPVEIADDGGLEALLRDQRGKKVSFKVPRRGPLRQLLAFATANAEVGLSRRLEARESVDAALDELRERLDLSETPTRIECYDVSTFRDSIAVASGVVFQDGAPCKADYRRYRIRDAAPDDDLACLREVFQRRFARADSEPLPDLLMVDGGRGQLAVLLAALSDAGLQRDAIALSKERDLESASPRVRRSGGLKSERVFTPSRANPVMLAPNSRGLLLLQHVRDESHRFAIEFQRKLRAKAGMTSILEELPGIGPTKRRALLRKLGSLRAVRGASQAELQAVPGISARDAATVFRFFDRADHPDGPDGLVGEAEAVAEVSERKPTAQKETNDPI